jgi:hypothetical protein
MNTYSQDQDTNTNATAYREGPVARGIEKRTAKLPSDIFLWAAGASIVASLAFEVIGMVRGSGPRGILGMMGGRRKTAAPLASFVGLWAPSFLLLGVYNKIVKVAGSDRMGRMGSDRMGQ